MKDKITRFALISVGILSSIILIYLFVDNLLPVILPFAIAWLVAAITVSPSRKIADKTKLPERIIRLVLSILIALTFFASVGLLVWKGATSIWNFLTDLDEGNKLYDIISGLLSSDAPLLGGFLPDEFATKISSAVGEIISNCLTMLAEGITSLGLMLPQFFFFIVVTLISLVYFALDYDKITAFLKSFLPQKLISGLQKVKNTSIYIIKKYIFSYSIILLITYFTLFVGFLILRIKHAAVLALFVALLDILPIIGVGTVLIPWSIFEFVSGNSFLGIGLLILFVSNTVIRQFSEPKIVGKSLDLHPIITLMMIYIGYALFGIVGMLILPVVLVSIGAILKGDNSSEIA